MTRKRLLAEADPEELNDWQAIEKLEGPLGPRRGDWQAAIVAWAATLPYQKGHQRIEMTDFLLEFGKEFETSEERAEALFKKFCGIAGAPPDDLDGSH